MSVYNPSGAGNVHIDRVISGGSRKGSGVATKRKKATGSPIAVKAPAVKMADQGMGFQAAAASVQRRQGISKKAAQAIIAAGAREASPAAKKANPNLAKVAGVKKVPAKKATKAMADAPVSARQRRTSTTDMVRRSATKSLPSQSSMGNC
jgi:hypothetical protein